MDRRFILLTARAARREGVVTLEDVHRLRISSSLLHDWVEAGLLERLGPRSLRVSGAPRTWRQELVAAVADLGGAALVAGRAAAGLYGLDGFTPGPVEFLVERCHRGRRRASVLGSRVIVSTTRPIPPGDVRRLDGIRCSSAERTILDGPRFGFTRIETEQAIDSALRLGLVAEGRLRERVLAEPWSGVAGSRVLLNALVDAGGHSALERAFLRLVRRNGLPRPRLQVVHRSGGQHVARVDALFPPDLVVEVAGHGTHATRRQRQIDAQRQTELTLLGRRLLTFTYEDVADRPQWVARRIAEALAAPPGTCP